MVSQRKQMILKNFDVMESDLKPISNLLLLYKLCKHFKLTSWVD